MAKGKKGKKRRARAEKAKQQQQQSTTTTATRHLPVPVTGLQNLGNTCFFNSTMQCLTQIPQLHNEFNRCQHNNIELGKVSKSISIFLNKYRKTVDLNLNPSKQSSASLRKSKKNKQKGKNGLKPGALLNAIRQKAPWISKGRQHDAHEVLMLLLGSIDDEYKKNNKTSVKGKEKDTPKKITKKPINTIMMKCNACQKYGAITFHCPCKLEHYCSKTCQTNNWTAHRKKHKAKIKEQKNIVTSNQRKVTKDNNTLAASTEQLHLDDAKNNQEIGSEKVLHEKQQDGNDMKEKEMEEEEEEEMEQLSKATRQKERYEELMDSGMSSGDAMKQTSLEMQEKRCPICLEISKKALHWMKCCDHDICTICYEKNEACLICLEKKEEDAVDVKIEDIVVHVAEEKTTSGGGLLVDDLVSGEENAVTENDVVEGDGGMDEKDAFEKKKNGLKQASYVLGEGASTNPDISVVPRDEDEEPNDSFDSHNKDRMRQIQLKQEHDHVEGETKENKSSSNTTMEDKDSDNTALSIPQRIFGALCVSHVTCSNCKNVSETTAQELVISLPVPMSGNHNPHSNKRNKNKNKRGKKGRNNKNNDYEEDEEAKLEALTRGGLSQKTLSKKEKKRNKKMQQEKDRILKQQKRKEEEKLAARWKGVDVSTRNEIEIVMNTLLNDIEKRIELNVINKEKELLKNQEEQENKEKKEKEDMELQEMHLKGAAEKERNEDVQEDDQKNEYMNPSLAAATSSIASSTTTSSSTTGSSVSLVRMPPLLEKVVKTSTALECTLEECLASYSSSEVMSEKDGNGIACDQCSGETTDGKGEIIKKGILRDGLKRIVLHQLPNVLILHLKRFHYSNAGKFRKIDTKVSTPLVLDVGAYSTVVEEEEDGEGGRSTVYDLVGVVSHSGGFSSGHYIAVVKGMDSTLFENGEVSGVGGGVKQDEEKEQEEVKEEELILDDVDKKESESEQKMKEKDGVDDGVVDSVASRWFRISDSSVRECSESETMSQQAFILFYARRE